MSLTTDEIETSLLWFSEEVLGNRLYDWQIDTLEPFDHASEKLTMVSLATPNGSGKSAVIITTLVLGWLALYPKGRVVCTSADGKQLDGQVMPSIESHRGKFPSWTFLNRQVTTPTGGRFVAFTTDQAGRAEGWHKIDDIEGPLLIICDEAKSVPEEIFNALDRCTFNAILLASSPGKMSGSFYASQTKPELGYVRINVGLKDCPHIGQDKIDRIIAKHGPNSPFTRSALHGEFLELFDGDPVYYAYSQQIHEVENLGWPHGATMVVGCDVGTTNASVIGAVKAQGDNVHIWIMREIVLEGSDTDRQSVELLKTLAVEFPWFNKGLPVCPQTLFYCDPAARNSSFTKRGATSSALKVFHSNGIFPGYKIGMQLQPSIAAVNRLMQRNHQVDRPNPATGEKVKHNVWHFKIDPKKCPRLTDALRGRYRYPVAGESGFGTDLPMKGAAIQDADHACFVAGTLVLTTRGEIPIETLTTADSVFTRHGICKVVAAMSHSASVGRYSFTNGAEIICTADHPFWSSTQCAMIPVENLTRLDILCACNRAQKLLSIAGRFIDATLTRIAAATAFISSGTQRISTTKFGRITMGRDLNGIMSTTRTKTQETTPSTISFYALQSSTQPNIGTTSEPSAQPSSASPSAHSQKNGTLLQKAANGTDSTQKTRGSGLSLKPSGLAINVGKNTPSPLPRDVQHSHVSARIIAEQPVAERIARTMWTKFVSIVARISGIAVTARSPIVLESAEQLPGKRIVFNLTVEGEHEYFANGLLVSNCDAMRYLICNVIDIAEESYDEHMKARYPEVTNPEGKRRI